MRFVLRVITAVVFAGLAATGAVAQSMAQNIAQRMAQSAGTPTISAAQVIAAEAPSQTPIAIKVGPLASIPKNAFLRLRGLPPMAALTEGYAIGPGSWAVALSALPGLKIVVPASAEGRSDIVISLVSVDGAVLAETQSALTIDRGRQAAAGNPGAVAVMPSGPPALTAPRILSPEDRERAQRLMKRGQDALKDADISEARLFFEKAADAGLAEAALALGATYDAAELDRLNVRGAQADARQARRWYERAAQLGSPDARQRLQKLGN